MDQKYFISVDGISEYANIDNYGAEKGFNTIGWFVALYDGEIRFMNMNRIILDNLSYFNAAYLSIHSAPEIVRRRRMQPMPVVEFGIFMSSFHAIRAVSIQPNCKTKLVFNSCISSCI